MQKYFNNVTNRVGDAIVGAAVTVTLTETGALATIYSDNGVTPTANPLTTDNNGQFSFYAANGRYTLSIAGSGFAAYTIGDVLLEDDSTAAQVDYTPDGAGAVDRTVQDKLRETVSVKDFGAAGDGATDDTAAFAAAMAASDTVIVPAGTYVVGNGVYTSGVRLVGAGKGATTIKWKAASAEASLFKFTGAAALRVEFENLTIDGNKANQTDSTGYYAAVLMDSAGGSALLLRDVRFTNGRIQDAVMRNPEATPSYFHMEGCEFDNGLIGSATRAASYVQAQDNVMATWIGNRASMPNPGAESYGRAGFLHQRVTASTSTYYGRCVAHGNHFEYVGRGISDTLGCIDVYSGCDMVSIQGNTSKGSSGRFIDVKSDCGEVVIVGNTVIDYWGSVAPIVFFGQLSSTTYTAAGIQRNLIVANNIVRNSLTAGQGKGIQIDGQDAAASQFINAIVQGNIVDQVNQYGIYVYNMRNVSILGNKVSTGARGVYVDSMTGICEVRGNSFRDLTSNGIIFGGAGVLTADVIVQGNTFDNADGVAVGLFNPVNSFVIKGNVIRDCTTAIQTTGATAQSSIVENEIRGETTTWSKSGTYGLLAYEGNLTTVGPSFATRELTIATGTVTAYADWHYVDTEGDAATDDLDTINGGYDGRRVVLFAANSSRDVVLKDGTGNLRLAGDFTMNNSEDTIELIYRTSAWHELRRSDNGA